MLFNSFEFLLFFPMVTLLYFALPYRHRVLFLLAASCLFYMAFVPAYILILAFTIVVDYFAGLMLEKYQGRQRKAFLVLSLAGNIGVLVVFKYYGFLNQNLSVVAHLFGGEAALPALNIILPVGLSFHTFQAMSYIIEVYRGAQKAERDFLTYALYVMFYPQMVAGPIERPQNLMHQFREKHDFDYDRVVSGLRLMLWGFLKKTFIADRLAAGVASAFAEPTSTSGPVTLLAVYFFTFQIYCDFSAYTDIARGAARVMGFNLTENFNLPYFSTSIGEFWQRWHISLSTWFRDYLYIPLGGNRRSFLRNQLNILAVFLVSGLWHGASWNFVIWGALHGTAFLVYNLTKSPRQKIASGIGLGQFPAIRRALSMALTFHFVAFAWIFFRAASLQDAFALVGQLFHWENALSISRFSKLGINYLEILLSLTSIAFLMLAESTSLRLPARTDLGTWPSWARWVGYYAAALLIGLLGNFSLTKFIYFQF